MYRGLEATPSRREWRLEVPRIEERWTADTLGAELLLD